MRKLTISTSVLKNMAARCASISTGGGILPVLNYAKIVVNHKEVTFIATDLETSMQTKTMCDSNDEFSFLWDIKDINDVCGKLPELPLTIEYDEANLKIKLSTLAGEFEYVSEAVNTFPALPENINDITFELTDGFVGKMKIAAEFTSADTLRPAITGVCFHIINSELFLVGSDMSSLYVSEPFFLFDIDEPLQIVVPAKTIKKLSAFDIKGEIKVSINESCISFSTEKTIVYSKLIDAKFPDYRSIIPIYEGNFSVDLKAIQQCLDLVSVVANKTTNQVEFKVEQNKLILKASDEGIGKRGKTELSIKKHLIEDFSFILNCVTTQKILRNFKNVSLFHTDGAHNKAFIFKEPGCNDTYLLMPLMIAPNK